MNICHLNTQSLTSSFAEFESMLYMYKFDICTLSETWLTDNQHLLEHVSIPGYDMLYRNRSNRRGGGVGIYIKDHIKYTQRRDLIEKEDELEHLWIEVQGKNKNSNVLVGVFYQPNFDAQSQHTWLSKFDKLLNEILSSWSGQIVITGDFNINLLNQSAVTQHYADILESHNLIQHVKKATRKNTSLIDHICTNFTKKVKLCDVLPTPYISDHDLVYASINARYEQYAPRFKYIRDFKKFEINRFTEDVKSLPFNIVYASDTADDKLDLLNKLITSCIDRHAPLRRVRVTRPPAPWLKDLNIIQLQQDTNKARYKAHQTKCESDWNDFRNLRNKLKQTIKFAKRNFYRKALSEKRPDQIWKFIHRILHPKKSRINIDPSTLNDHYLSTAKRVLNASPVTTENLMQIIESFPDSNSDELSFSKVTYNDVITELKAIRSDCSAGFDNIPVSLIKVMTEYLASPLTHVINTGIEQNTFHKQWKIGKITPIPKCDQSSQPDDYRPVTVLPILSKVYERLIAKQIIQHVNRNNIYKSTMSGFRRNHSTTTLMLKIRDDIIKAMERGEVTLALFSDYSKAFDTVEYSQTLRKLHHIGFSKKAIAWMLSYLTDRYQFVQINDKRSSRGRVRFGVPQGSVLGPVIFNLYVTDLQDCVQGNIYQFADDTSSLEHCKVKNLPTCVERVNKQLSEMQHWSTINNLSYNQGKTKCMLLSSTKMCQFHNLDEYKVNINHIGKSIEQVKVIKLLGVLIDEHLTFENYVNEMISSCYKKLFVLRKLKKFAPRHVRKQLAEALVLSKLDYCNVLLFNITQIRLKRLQKVQKAAAGFVNGKYCKTSDIIDLGWLPIIDKINYNLLKLTHQVLHNNEFPDYLTVQREQNRHSKRHQQENDCEVRLATPNTTKTFSGVTSRLFNELPSNIRGEEKYDQFCKNLKSFYLDKALARYLNTH